MYTFLWATYLLYSYKASISSVVIVTFLVIWLQTTTEKNYKFSFDDTSSADLIEIFFNDSREYSVIVWYK